MTTGIRAVSDGLSGVLQVGGADTLSFGADSSGQLTGFRNRLINGTFLIDQRQFGSLPSLTVTAGAALSYIIYDRWYIYCTGANITATADAISSTGKRIVLTGATSVTGFGIGQRIEHNNSYDLAGKNATLSCSVSSTHLTTLTWSAYRASTTNSFGTLASPTKTLIATGTFNISTTTSTYSATFAVPSTPILGIEIILSGGALLAAQTCTIGAIQLEKGSIRSELEFRPIPTELALCQRYFEAGTFKWVAYQQAGSVYTSTIPFVVTKFSVPTLATSSTSVSNTTTPGITATSGTHGINQTGTATATGFCQYLGTFTATSEL